MEKLGLVLTIFLSFFVASWTHQESKETQQWVQNYLLQPKEKVAKLHFFLQDVLSGPNATVWEVARSAITANSSSGFGRISALDDLITAEPDRNSMKLGRAQGFVTFSDLQVPALAMNINFVFTAGTYNGSTLSILGRNPFTTSLNRELPVVGGTGVFRMARGFCISNTYSVDPAGSYRVVEFTVYVFYV